MTMRAQWIHSMIGSKHPSLSRADGYENAVKYTKHSRDVGLNCIQI